MFFSKFSPFSGVPAGTELFTNGVGFLSAALAAFFSIAGLGFGVRGALKGCAADVDVAAGGACEEVGEPWRGVGVEAEETGVALCKAGEVDMKRRDGGAREREARRQVRHIIVDVWTLLVWLGEVVVPLGTFGDAPSRFSAFRRHAKSWDGQSRHHVSCNILLCSHCLRLIYIDSLQVFARAFEFNRALQLR